MLQYHGWVKYQRLLCQVTSKRAGPCSSCCIDCRLLNYKQGNLTLGTEGEDMFEAYPEARFLDDLNYIPQHQHYTSQHLNGGNLYSAAYHQLTLWRHPTMITNIHIGTDITPAAPNIWVRRKGYGPSLTAGQVLFNGDLRWETRAYRRSYVSVTVLLAGGSSWSPLTGIAYEYRVFFF